MSSRLNGNASGMSLGVVVHIFKGRVCHKLQICESSSTSYGRVGKDV